jgi:hypothetical protein
MAMNRAALRFWAAAVLAAAAWSVLTSALLPYEALGLESGAERGRAWLLTLWTTGVMAICFGAAGILSYAGPMGYKEVADAGSLTQAIEARRRSKRQQGSLYTNFAWWLIVTGAMLVCIYFLVWGFAYA